MGSSSDESESKDGSDQSDNDIQLEVSTCVTQTTWIEWYCSLNGNQFYVQVDEDYIRDDFNLIDIPNQVPYYSRALSIILDCGDEDDYMSDDNSKENQQILQSSTQLLYGLIHCRYILTNKGMQAMLEKYENHTFGNCHNYSCENMPGLPIGVVDAPSYHTAKIFCPRCNEAYHPPKQNKLCLIDGAFFGTTFAHLFLMQHQSLVT